MFGINRFNSVKTNIDHALKDGKITNTEAREIIAAAKGLGGVSFDERDQAKAEFHQIKTTDSETKNSLGLIKDELDETVSKQHPLANAAHRLTDGKLGYARMWVRVWQCQNSKK